MHLEFFFKIGPQNSSYGHFKIIAQEHIRWGEGIEYYWSKTKTIAQECTQWGEGIDSKDFVSLLYISVAIKASLLKFSMFNIHKNTYIFTNISCFYINIDIYWHQQWSVGDFKHGSMWPSRLSVWLLVVLSKRLMACCLYLSSSDGYLVDKTCVWMVEAACIVL